MELSIKINPRQMLSLDDLKKLEEIAAAKNITFEELVSSTLMEIAARSAAQDGEVAK